MATKNVQPPTPPRAVLSHPAFDRPAVLNLRGPGRKKGTVSLATQRRNRSLAQARAEMQSRAEEQARDLVHVLSQSGPEPGARVLLPAAPSAARPGMPPGEAAVIAAAVAILDARLRVPGMVLDTPFLVKALLRLHLAERESEAFAVLFIDAQTRLIAFEVMFVGTLTQTSVYPREIVRRALEHNAGAVVLSHNHPSGAAEPSRADEYLTQTLKSALALVDVCVLDHVVIAGADAVSFAERGLL